MRESNSPPTQTDEQLIDAALRASGRRRKELLGTLFERHYERVAKWCLHLVGNESDALDLAQEVFVKAQASLHGFRQESTFTTWLHIIARRCFLDSVRSREKAETELSDELAEVLVVPQLTDPIEQIDQEVRAERLRTVMSEALNSKERRVLFLRYAEGLTLPQITERMKLDNRSGAKALIVSSFRKLRHTLPTHPPRERRS